MGEILNVSVHMKENKKCFLLPLCVVNYISAGLNFSLCKEHIVL